MRPSSTSSSDGGRVRHAHWGLFALVLLGSMIAAEAALRTVAVRERLPLRTHFYTPAIAGRLDAIERVIDEHGRVDVLFTGSSIVLTDLHPEVFDSLTAALPQPTVSFNAGMAGMWPAGLELYLRHVWLPAARPRVVVQGIRYPELRVQDYAKHDTQVWTGTIELGWREGDLLARARSAVTSRVYLLQYRGVLTNVLERFVAGRPGEAPDEMRSRGYTPRPLARARFDAASPDLPNDGTCAHGACDPGFAAIHRTRDAVHAAGAAYVLVNVPEHGMRWAGANGVSRYQAYLEAVTAFAEREQIPFIDVTDGDPFRFDADDAYADVSHMSVTGSERFTTAVASRLTPLMVAHRSRAPALAAVGSR